MPKIPTKINQVPLRIATQSPGMAAYPARELERAGERLESMGDRAAWVFSNINAAEIKAIRAVKADEGEIFLNDEAKKIAESYRLRTDFENFDKDLADHLGRVGEKLRGIAADDQVLGQAFNKVFADKSRDLRDVIANKRVQIIIDRGNAANLKNEAETIENYVNSDTKEGRQLIKDQFNQRQGLRADLGLQSYTDAQKMINDFDAKTKVRLTDLEEANLISMGKDNPWGAVQAIDSGNFKNIKPDALERYRSSFASKAESLETKTNQAAEKAYKDQREQAKAALGAGIMRGEDPTDQVLNLMDLGIFDLEDKKAVMADWDSAVKKTAKEEIENDASAYAEAVDGVYRVNPTISEARLRQLWREGKLNDKTYTTLATQLTSRLEILRKEEKSDVETQRNRDIDHGATSIRDAFRISGIAADKINPIEQYIFQRALPEFFQRTQKEKDANPFNIAREIIVKYRPIFRDMNVIDVKMMKKLLPFASPRDDSESLATKLKEMKGKISEIDYYSYAQIVSDINDREETIKQNQAVMDERKRETGKK